MKLLIFTLLLLLCLLNFTPANSIPAPLWRRAQSTSHMVTTPLKRLHIPRSAGLHSQVSLQQYINHGSKRLARMTGREEPSEHALRSELHKRLYLLESGTGARSGAPVEAQGIDSSGIHHRKVHAAVGKGAEGTRMIGTSCGTIVRGNDTSTGASPLEIQAAKNGNVTVAKPPSANDSLGLNIEANDVAYLAVVKIGTPPQNFQLLMDSGSADFWVVGENCQSSQGGCGNRATLGTQSSSSFVQSTTGFNVTYGSGAVEGLLCQDTVNIAGLELMNHTFGIATAESVRFASNAVAFDSIMELAQSKLSQEGVLTPLESLVANKLIQAPISSFRIPRLTDHLDDGDVTFGGLDTTKFINDSLVTLPNVNKMGFWRGAMNTVMVDGNNTGLTGHTAVLDTGTTLILAPPADAKKVAENLGGACDTQQCTIPCTTRTSLALSFGNTSFAIDPRDLAVLPIDINNPDGSCAAGIQPQQIGAATEWLSFQPCSSAKCLGWRCFPEECLLLYQCRNE